MRMKSHVDIRGYKMNNNILMKTLKWKRNINYYWKCFIVHETFYLRDWGVDSFKVSYNKGCIGAVTLIWSIFNGLGYITERTIEEE